MLQLVKLSKSSALLFAFGGVFLPACHTESKNHSGEPSQIAKSQTVKPEVVDDGCPHMDSGSCSHAEPEKVDNKAPSAEQAGAKSYGAPLGKSPRIELSTLLSAPDSYHGKTVQVEGHVRRVCAKRGCWMEISTEESNASPSCRVTFKDYSFLVPVDSKGSSVKLEGVVQLTRVKKAAVDHYEAEGASFQAKDADGSAQEIRLVATGVVLKKS